MTDTRVVPASEYDALCDLLVAVVDESTSDPVPMLRRELGDHEAGWVGRIVDGERSRELFSDAPNKP